MVVWDEADLPPALRDRIAAQENKKIQKPTTEAKSPKKSNPTPTEHQEQVKLCEWLDLKRIIYFAVPNGSYKGKASAGIFKSEGLQSGVPDVVVFLENKIVFVELKRIKGSKTSDQQLFWIDKINSYGYAKASVCFGADMAIEFIEFEIANKL